MAEQKKNDELNANEETKRGRRGRKPQPPTEGENVDADVSSVHTIRAKKSTMDALNEMKDGMGATSMDEALSKLCSSFTFKQARERIPERATEIAEAEAACRKFIDLYTNSLIIGANAEERARMLVKEEMDELKQTIVHLNKAQRESDAKVLELESQNQRLQEELQQVKAERDALRTNQDGNAAISSRLDEFERLLGSLTQSDKQQ